MASTAVIRLLESHSLGDGTVCHPGSVVTMDEVEASVVVASGRAEWADEIPPRVGDERQTQMLRQPRVAAFTAIPPKRARGSE